MPCVGDFVRRGLSQPFVAAWDRWMQALLISGQDAMGTDWQDHYLTAPIWRFAMAPGLCGPQAVAGLVMPSVDRVGRRFPLCIAAEMDGPAWGAYLAVQPMIDQLEAAALGMLDDDATLDQLEQTLGACSPPAAVRVAGDLPRNSDVMTTASIWVAAVGDQSRVLLSAALPQGAAQAKALFDTSDPYWNAAQSSEQGS